MIFTATGGFVLDTSKIVGPMQIGTRVKVSEESNYFEDWKDRKVTICGVRIDRWGKIDITICEDYGSPQSATPVADLTSPHTDGFQPGDLIRVP